MQDEAQKPRPLGRGAVTDWQPMHSAPHDRPIRLARDNGCEWEFWVGIWSPQVNHYPWLVLGPEGMNWLPDGRPDYWRELEDPEPPYVIE